MFSKSHWISGLVKTSHPQVTIYYNIYMYKNMTMALIYHPYIYIYCHYYYYLLYIIIIIIFVNIAKMLQFWMSQYLP